MASDNVVLVHGGFVDGSGWEGAYGILKRDGYKVSVVQNPTLSLEGDVAATKLIIDAQSEPVILVGHSYGGAVITAAGNDPNVAALVYIAAFAPDEGESVNTLIADPPPDAPVPPILPPQDGFLFLDGRSFTLRSRATSMATRRRSWRIRRSRGGSMPWAARSARRPGGASQAGTSSRPRTG
jgi:pimeloyl-ACP methyl ester carboxylesterase